MSSLPSCRCPPVLPRDVLARSHTTPTSRRLSNPFSAWPPNLTALLTPAHTKTDVYKALGRAGKTLFEGGSKGITIERFQAVDAKGKL